uniref:Uncharacterized protein n=1 Tax=Romanomermis culicivorax TaxID=13658 RepID=A0A915HMG5_ROMCU
MALNPILLMEKSEKEHIRNEILSVTTLHNSLGEKIPSGKIASSFFLYKLKTRDSAMVKELLSSYSHQILPFLASYTHEYLIKYAQATGDAETVAEILSQRQTSAKDLVGCTKQTVEKVRPYVERKGLEYIDKLEKLVEFGQRIHLKVTANNAANVIDIPDDIMAMDETALSDYVKSSNYSTLNQHFQTLIRNQKVDELCRLHSTMESLNKYSVPSLYISAMNLMLKANKLNEAVHLFTLIMKTKNPDFTMATQHLLNFFIFLAEHKHFTDLLKCLELLLANTPTTTTSTMTSQSPSSQQTTDFVGNGGFQFSSQLKEHLLEGLIEKIFNYVPNDESTKERSDIFDALCKYKDFNVSYFHLNFAFDRLLSNDQTDVAMRVFDIIYKNTNKMVKPMRLMQALARKDNVADLQKVYDCMVASMGDNRATIKLAISLAVVGRMKDAMRVLSAPNIRFSGESMVREGIICFEHKDAQSLSCLLELTRGKTVYAREKLYLMLLNLYRQQKDYSAALNVWTTMQDENFITSKPILDLISEILKENNQEVPFEAAEEKLETTVAPKFSAATSSLMSKLLANSEKSSSSAPQSNDNSKDVNVDASASIAQ